MTGSSVISSTSSSVRTVVSSRCRNIARPAPRSRPRTSPSARLRVGTGLVGVLLVDAGSTSDTLIGEDFFEPSGRSTSETTSGKVVPIAVAIS